jgi:ATP phosphoribosyltransferase
MNIRDSSKIRFCLPSKGRLSEPAADLIRRAGYAFRLHERRLYATCSNADIIFIFARADDIPVLVASGVAGMGITGGDLVVERDADVASLLDLGVGQCRLCLAGPETMPDDDLGRFAGGTIATSFPRTTQRFFAGRGIDVRIMEMMGSMEIMVSLQLCDGIVDIVETGDSLQENHLRVMAEIGRYQSVLIAHHGVVSDPRVGQIRRRLEGVLVAGRYTVLEYNIPAGLLKEAEKITPGYRSPTVSHLDQEGWLAVKVMVPKAEVVQVMDRLEQMGASAILETEIRNCRL